MANNILELQKQIFLVKEEFSKNLANALSLQKVFAPLYLPSDIGMNDHLNGFEEPVNFIIDDGKIKCEIVHSLAKWKRNAIDEYNVPLHTGIYTDMLAIRKTEMLDNIHSNFVDQWDWEAHIDKQERNLDTLKSYVKKIVHAIFLTQKKILVTNKSLKPIFDDKVTFITSQELEDMYPDLEMKKREEEYAKKIKGTFFLIGIGWKLNSGIIHDGRAPDYDDWKLNGDLIVYYPILNRAVEISSMGIRVDAQSIKEQCKERDVEEKLQHDYHQKIVKGKMPFTIGGGIGQSRLTMLLLNKKHIGEVQATVWPKSVIGYCKDNKIKLL